MNFTEEVRRTMNRSLSTKESKAAYAMGLAGEAGEVVDLMKKHLFQGHPIYKQQLAKELGDVLWCIEALMQVNELTREECEAAVIEKLRIRYPSGFTEAASQERVDVTLLGTNDEPARARYAVPKEPFLGVFVNTNSSVRGPT